MHLRTLFVILAVATGAGTAPAQAKTVMPCEVYVCMAGISGAGATGGPACAPSLVYWHSVLAVYSPYFNPPASALRRQTYLMSCPGAHVATNAALLNTIISIWGYVP
ncbi:MAG TPA: hypothetical protein VGN24_06880 [Rhodanobacter sp.]|jgi:hypothetical protein|nr:hypothetical protein [Rhodanobacter sp.]